MSNVRIGTSGWHYPTGKGTWDGVFYPPKRGRGKAFDELACYAEHFDTVEVNSTFYGQPRAEVSRGWARRTPPGFEFSVKLYQKFTHPKMYQERLEHSMPPHRRPVLETREHHGASASASGGATFAPKALRRAAPELAGELEERRRGAPREVIKELSRPNAADLDEFRRGIDPLADAGKLGAVLAQFPPSFKNGEVERAYLVELLRALDGYPVAVELRHRSWSDAFGATLELLNSRQSAWVQIDEPKFNFSIRQNFLPNVRGFYYMRLHGRNVANWWKHAKAEDRYDYLYSSDELKEFTEVADAAKTLVKKLYLYTNNHFSAKSVANAAMIKHQLGEPIEGEYPPDFIDRFPALSRIVSVRPGLRHGLFEVPDRS